MRWIESEAEIDSVLGDAYTCVGIDSGRLPTQLTRLVFDELGTESIEYARLIGLLVEISGDSAATHTVLRPDPIYYFHKMLGRYPSFTIEAGDPAQLYLDALSETLKEGEIDNLGTFWSEYVISSPTQKWFIHAVRTSRENGGHLWIPDQWIKQASNCYKWLFPSASA